MRRADPLGDFIASQLKVQHFDVELVLPAHGGVYHDHRHRANQLIEHHRYREAEMLDLMRKSPQTAFEIAHQVFGGEERPIFHVMAATFETLAHLELAWVLKAGRADQRGVNELCSRHYEWIKGGLLIFSDGVFWPCLNERRISMLARRRGF